MPSNKFGFARANSLQTTPVLHLLLAGTLALGVGAVGRYLHPEISNAPQAALPVLASLAHPATAPETLASPAINTVLHSSPVEAVASASRAMAAAIKPVIAPKSELATREIEIRHGVNFADLLTDADVARPDALAVTAALAKVYDPRKLKSGQSVILSFTRAGADEALDNVTFQPEAAREVTIARNAAGGFTANFAAVPVTREHFAASAEIHSTLYEAGEAAHVPHALMASFMRIYSHAIDFQRDIRPGDRFEVLYDQPVTRDGAPAGEGNIIYAALMVGGKVKPVYRVTFSDGTADYFDDKGESIRRALLRTPVAAAHITSGFGMRMHPILGYSKMHQGVDFGAPPGSPIFAAGNGIVVEIDRKGSYGRYIRIRHNNRLETIYAHMSRFGQGLYRGAQVSQGEVIGYVGMTGRATGPHLHFEVHVNDKPVNPLSVDLPTGRVLEGKQLAAFKQGETKIKQEFTALTQKSGSGFTKASASAPAFGIRETASCGLRGGC